MNRLLSPLLITLVLALNAALLPASALAAQALAASPLQDTAPPGELFSSTSGQSKFLEVDEAYQLALSLEDPAPQTLVGQWHIADGYYLYHKSLGVTLYNRQGQVLSATPQIPAGTEKFDTIFQEVRELHYQSVSVRTALEGLPEAPAYVEVRYQGCAEAGLCYPPQNRYFRIDRALFTPIDTPPWQGTATPSAAQDESLGLALALLLAFVGGMILNLMPCVLPVLAIKVLSLSKAVHQPHLRHLHGWLYSAGVVSCFLVIAGLMLSLREGGRAIGWGFQLQSPMVIASLAYLFFFMALSLAGMFEIGSRWMGLGSQQSSRHGLLNSFNTGLLATVVASPCTAPFMGVAIGWAVTQSSTDALLVFAALGLGMAFPFALLCHLPKLLDKLPKPGMWMQRFKELCAYPLFATSLYLLWVLGHQTDGDTLITFLAGVLLLSFALWLWQNPSFWLRSLAGAAVAGSLFLGVYLPGQAPTAVAQPADSDAHIWRPYSPQLLQELRLKEQAVFINLTADWCITCLANEKVALSHESVQSAMARCDITYLKGDWTTFEPNITDLLARHRRNSVPLYLYYAPGKEAQILPQILTPERVTEVIGC